MGQYSDLFDDGKDTQANINLRFGIEAKPEDEAQKAALAKRYNLPVGVISEFKPDYETKAKVDDAKSVVEQSPKLRGWLAKDPQNAKLTHDDLNNMAEQESITSMLADTAKYITSADGAARGGMLTDISRAVRSMAAGAGPRFGAGVYGAVASPFEMVGLDSIGGFFRDQSRNATAAADQMAGVDKNAGTVERGVMAGFESAGQNIALMPAAFVKNAYLAGETAVLALMGLVTGGQSYVKARDAGLDPYQSTAYGIQDATAEIVTERYLGFAGFMKNVKAGASAGKLAMFELTKEIPGEMAATLWQNFNEWAHLNPEKSLQEFLAEQPEAMVQTVIATVVGGGTQIGAVHGARKILGQGQKEEQKATVAQQHAQLLGDLQKTMEASKVLERSPETLQSYMQDLLEDTGADKVFIDSKKLVEAGLDLTALAQAVPSVAAQLDQVETGGDIVIPTSELLTSTIGTEFAQPLIDNARTDVNGYSRVEAEQFMAEKGDKINAQVDAALQEAQGDQTFQQSKQAVEDKLLQDLNAAAVHHAKANQNIAKLFSSFYAVTAAKLGVTPEQMAKMYPLQFSNQMQQESSYDQAAKFSPPTLVQDENGNPFVNGHGLGIGYAEPTSRMEFIPTADNQQMFNFAIMDGDKYVGAVDALFVDGKPTDLYDIFIEPEFRKGGYAARAVGALLGTTADGKLGISNIVPEAQGFWEKLGVGIQNHGEGAAYDGTITTESFQASPAGKNAAGAGSLGGENQGAGAGGTFFQGANGQVDGFNDATQQLGDSIAQAGGEVKDTLQIDQLIDSKDIPTITLADLVGKSIFPTIADRTAAAALYTGIDSSQLQMAVPLLGGPYFPLRMSNWSANVVWANRGKGVTSQKAAKLKEGANYMLVVMGDANMHQSNSTVAAAFMGTLEAWARDGRISSDGVKALGQMVQEAGAKAISDSTKKLQKAQDAMAAATNEEEQDKAKKAMNTAKKAITQAEYLEAFPGFDDPSITHAYMDGISFYARKRILDLMGSKAAQNLGAPPMQMILDATREPSLAGHRWGDGVVLLEVDQKNHQVDLGTEGTTPHPDFPVGIRGKVVGKLDKAVNWELLWQDWLKKSKKKKSPRRAFELSKPIVNVTQDLVDRIGPIVQENIDGARQARLAADFAADNWKTSDNAVNAGGISPQEFVDAIQASAAKTTLTNYTIEEVTAGIKDGTMKLYQLGDGQIFFMLKTEGSKKILASVVNNEQGARGIGGPAVVLKAIQEGATDLDCFAVKNEKFPYGFLPSLYAAFGFRVDTTNGPYDYDSQYFPGLKEADAIKYWKESTPGFDPAKGMPQLVNMTWKGSEDERAGIVDRYIRTGFKGLYTAGVSLADGSTMSGLRSSAGAALEGSESSSSNSDGSGWDQGASAGASVSSRARLTVQGLAKLSDTELKNLGLTAQDRAAAQKAVGTGSTYNQPAYHGTPHRGIDKFSTDKIGTGEGAQAYGWGLYFAGKKDIAEWYRKGLSKSRVFFGDVNDDTDALIRDFAVEHAEGKRDVGERATRNTFSAYLEDVLLGYQGDDGNEILNRAKKYLRDGTINFSGKGQLYEVEIPEDDTMLLWDKPLSQQPDAVRQALEKLDWIDSSVFGEYTGQQLYEGQVRDGVTFDNKLRSDSQRDTSLALASAGIKGIKYLDGTSRSSGDGSYNYVVFSGDDVAIKNQFYQQQRGQISFAQDITKQASIISAMSGADLSTFIHEGGHFFMEVQADLAAKITGKIARGEQVTAGEQSILDDFNKTMDWFGIESTADMSQVDVWAMMSTDEKRKYHEQFARGWEAYAFEGNAPSIELQSVFQTFRAWLISVYKSIKQMARLGQSDIAGALDVKLTDEVRAVFDRMIATTDQIKEAEAARGMGTLFGSAEEAGMTMQEYEAYHKQATSSTQAAIDELQARGLRDMQWLDNARSRKLKELQKKHDLLRWSIKNEVTSEVMSQPVYRAWQFLTGKRVGPMEKSDARKAYEQALAEYRAQREQAEKDALDAEKVKLYAANPDAKGFARAQLVTKNKRQIDINVAQAMLEWDKQNKEPAKVVDQAEDLGPEFATGKLNTEDLRKLYGKGEDAIWRKLSERRMTSEENGMDPDVVATMFGYDSGDALVKALADAQDPKEVIDNYTDMRMLEEHGDIATPAGIERAADAAIHNDARIRFVATELKALNAAMSVRQKVPGKKHSEDILVKAAKDHADKVVRRLKVRDVRPAQYAAAAARAGREAEKSKGDIPKALEAKRNQLVNMHAAKQAYKVLDEIDAALEYFKRVSKPGNVPSKHHEQILALLEKFDLHKSTSLATLDNRAAFKTWVMSQLDQGMVPPNVEALLPKELFSQYQSELMQRNEDGDLIYASEEEQAKLLAGFVDQIQVRHYKDVTVEELLGLRDTVKQIEHIGKRTKKVLTDRKNREFAAVITRMRERIEDVAEKAGRKAGDTRTPNDTTGQSRLSWRGFFFSHIKAANLLHIMDGGHGGPMWEHLMSTANDAANAEVEDMARAHDHVQGLLKSLKGVGDITDKPRMFPSIGRSLNRQARIVMAMNIGNDSNLQRLLAGEGWTLQQIKPVLDTLTADDWNFVQAMWDYYETFRPRVGAMESELHGAEPEWIEARAIEVQTADGKKLKLRGGYAPVIFDPRASGKAASHAAEKDAKAMMQAARVASSVQKSFTKNRVEEVHNRPLMLSLDAMIGGIQDTIHYLHWQPWIIDANRMIKSLDEPIRKYYGAEVVKQLREWAADNAAGVRPARDAAERKVTELARNVSYAGLAFNIISAVKQVTGYTQSIAVVGSKWMGKGVARSMTQPRQAYLDAVEKSSFMRKRATTRMRDLAETRNTIQDQGKVRDFLDKGGYAMMLAMQTAVDVPTWWAGYERAIDAGADEEMAVAQADQAVIDAQGSGLQKDLASVERATGAIRLLTGFMSFMNTTMNVNYRILKSDQNVGAKAVDLVLVNTLPVLIGMLITAAIVPGGGDEEPEDLAKKFAIDQLGFVLGQMVGIREISQLGAAFMGQPSGDYGGAVGTRMAADILKLAKQIGQGEMDDSLRKAVINAAGDFFRLPSAQINRTWTGIEAVIDGETEGAQTVVAPAFGFKKQ